MKVEYNINKSEITNSRGGENQLILDFLKSDKENYFSDYIEFVQYYGAIPYLYTIPQVPTAYVGVYDIEDLYVYTNINYVNGKTDTSKIYIPVSELPEN